MNLLAVSVTRFEPGLIVVKAVAALIASVVSP